MNIHKLRLSEEPFVAIASGHKTIESRLYDEKRRKIQLGDQIVFINRVDSEQTVVVTVVGLLRYTTFHDLFSHNDPRKFGGESVEWLECQIYEFYSTAGQERYGVLGIEFEYESQ